MWKKIFKNGRARITMILFQSQTANKLLGLRVLLRIFTVTAVRNGQWLINRFMWDSLFTFQVVESFAVGTGNHVWYSLHYASTGLQLFTVWVKLCRELEAGQPRLEKSRKARLHSSNIQVIIYTPINSIFLHLLKNVTKAAFRHCTCDQIKNGLHGSACSIPLTYTGT